MITEKLNKILLANLGFIMLIYFIWFKFIRERLPRVIPFELSIISFLLLIYICSIYLFIVISFFYTYNFNSSNIIYIINRLYKPLIMLDYYIKPYLEIYLIKFIYILNNTVIRYIKNPYLKIYLFLQLFPKVIIAFALFIDTFYFHSLYIIYKVILISLIMFLGKYIIYSFKHMKEQYIIQLESKVDILLTNYIEPEDNDPLFNTGRSVRVFIDIQTSCFIFDEKFSYTFIPIYNNAILEEPLNTEFKQKMNLVLLLSIFIEEYGYAENYSRCKYAKALIYTIYLICWVYILIVSIHTLPADTLDVIWTIKDIEEPFSAVNINEYG